MESHKAIGDLNPATRNQIAFTQSTTNDIPAAKLMPTKSQLSYRGPISRILALGLMFLCLHQSGMAQQDLTAEQERFFETEIRPIFIQHCIECHGVDEQEGDLRLDHREAFFKGGGSGPIFDPNQPTSSRIIQSIQYTDNDLQMPPDGKLPRETIERLKRWVEQGALWPADQRPTSSQPLTVPPEQRLMSHKAEHWSYQPITECVIPEISLFPTVQKGSQSTPYQLEAIDSFVGAKLEQNGLLANPKADKRTLIHRAYFNLTGLPPSYEEVQAFLSDDAPNAFEKIIDHLLESSHYGERWARHWLDIARYGDTTGYIAGSAETRYPYAYTYRDYVIDAFNSDKPFDQFIIEQIAADRLELPDEEQESLAAMGFLTVGRRFMNRQVDIIDDQIDVISRGFLGLSVACSRCHDHKYDAIPTADYYSLYGVLASSVAPNELPLIGDATSSPHYGDFLAATAAKQKEVDDWLEERRVATELELQQRIADYLAYLARSLPQYANGQKIAMQGERGPLRRAAVQRWQQYLTQPQNSSEPIWQLLRYLGGLSTDDFPAAVGKMADIHAAEETTSKDLTFLAEVSPKLLEKLRKEKPADFPEAATLVGKHLESLLSDWRKLQENDSTKLGLPSPEDETLRQILLSGRAPATLNTAQAVTHLDQGERNKYNQLKKGVTGISITHPGAPPRAMVLNDRAKPIEPVIFKRGVASNRGDRVPRRFLQILEMVDGGKSFQDGSGRLELARAIASPKNPLTARVIVNRVWQHQFGEGLVRTPSDFGIRGEMPSHPQLLDYLAHRFMKQGWSIKKLQKEIMLSKTWQQTSSKREDAFLADPENRFLWRMPRRRLEFEPLRDRVLAASNELDNSIGGRSVEIHEDSKRRAIYAYIDREDLPGLLANFDLPSPDASRAQRSQTTVPQQALYLMNSPFILSQAETLSKLSEEKAKAKEALNGIDYRTERTRQMYRLALSRDPNRAELSTALNFTDPVKVAQFRENADLTSEKSLAPRWTHGFGGWNGERVEFTPFPFFSGNAWQFSEEFPHPNYRYLYLRADGGHTGSTPTLSPIRQWTSPVNGIYRISGLLKHPAEQGDGVIGQLALKTKGSALDTVVKEWKVFNSEVGTTTAEINLRRGDKLLMIVHLNQETGWDSFTWNTTIDLIKPTADERWDGATTWNSETEFGISSSHQQKNKEKRELDPWIQLAQALFLSNEFAFVD